MQNRNRDESHQQKQSDAEFSGVSRRNFLIGTGAFSAGLMGVPGMTRASTHQKGVGGDNTYDVVIVGSGINSLVAAGLLAKNGRRVCVLERNDRPGGCIRTEALTVDGFTHDVLSGFYPLFVTSPGYGELKDDLHQNGLEFVNTEFPTGVLLPDNRSLILNRSHEKNIAAMEKIAKGDGKAYQEGLAELLADAKLTFGLLSNELWSYDTLRLISAAFWNLGFHGLSSYFGSAVRNCRGWLENNFQSEVSRALLAPWVLHTGLGPDDALSGFMDRLIFLTLEQAGMPVVEGGSHGLVDAFRKYIEGKSGVFAMNADVEKIIIQSGKAIGVRTMDGEEYHASQAVICNVTPTQLYERLLAPETVPAKIAKQTRAYRYGRGDMQIHLALSEPPQWPEPVLRQVPMVHVTPGLDGVSKAVNQAERGLLPEEGTIVVGQPTAVDPSRAPEGKWIFWLQLQELPRDGKIKGDAAAKIAIPADGKWHANVAEAYADRIIDRLASQIPNLKRSILARKVLSPADLEAYNMNLVGGDPYSGMCSLDQFFFWRPLRATKNHSTPIKNLFHIGASTHPGPGLGGVSGYLAAKEIIG